MAYRGLGRGLPLGVEAAAHRQPAHFQLLLGEHGGELLLQPTDEPGGGIDEVFGFGGLQAKGCLPGFQQLTVVDEARLPHPPQHDGATFQGEVGIDQGGIDRGGGGKAGDQRRLRQRQLIRCLGEIDPGSIGNAVGTGAEVDKIEILLKDLLLAELALDLASQGRLLQLAHQGAVLAEKDHPGQLLGDRAGTLLHRALADVATNRPQDAHRVDAIVAVEAPIFRGDESLLHQPRHLAGLQLLPGGRAGLVKHRAIGGQNGEGAGAIEAANALDIGEIGIHSDVQRHLGQGHRAPEREGHRRGFPGEGRKEARGL